MEIAAKNNDIMPTVFIVDDEPAIRSGIADLVASMEFAVKTFESAKDFLDAYDASQLGCLVLDLQMPGMTGLELQRELLARGIKLPVIIITGHGNVAASVESMKYGAIDFIEKPFRQHVLREAIRKAIDRGLVIQENELCRRRYLKMRSMLTDRERQIMEMLMSGMTDKQIACQLCVSHRAIAFHRSHILAKMQVSSIIELTRLSILAESEK